MTTVAELNRLHGLPGRVHFHEEPDGFVFIAITTPLATAQITLQGAQITQWAPLGAQPVIWLSDAATFRPGKSIRGGTPVCWPWFGPHALNSQFPAHGFARTLPWEILTVQEQNDGTIRIELHLPPESMPKDQWPHDTTLHCDITIGTQLDINLITLNRDDHPITVGQALHTYFRIGDIQQVRLTGLEDCPYLDKTLNGQRFSQSGPVHFSQETDRIYLDSRRDILIEDPLLQRRIRIIKSGSASTVVWNPWIEKAAKMGDLGDQGYLTMVCVENANAADDVVQLGPDQAHHLRVRYCIESLA